MKYPKNNSEINLGEILLRKNIDLLDELVIQGEKSSMELSLDKGIFQLNSEILIFTPTLRIE